MTDEDADVADDMDWHWADEQLVGKTAEGKKPFVKRALGVLLFFADDVVVVLIIAYILYRLLR